MAVKPKSSRERKSDAAIAAVWNDLAARQAPMTDVGVTYRHRESGRQYFVTGLCLREHDLEPCLLYRPVTNSMAPIWCRPLAEFLAKFEEVRR